jgi:hypothetical protein
MLLCMTLPAVCVVKRSHNPPISQRCSLGEGWGTKSSGWHFLVNKYQNLLAVLPYHPNARDFFFLSCFQTGGTCAMFRGAVSAARAASTLPTANQIGQMICESQADVQQVLVRFLLLHILFEMVKILSWWLSQATGRAPCSTPPPLWRRRSHYRSFPWRSLGRIGA